MPLIRRNERDYLSYRPGHGGTVEIDDIAVYSERQRGTGRAMVEAALARTGAAKVYALARAENAPARKFYEALGFRPVELPGFYEDGDAVMYYRG